MSDTLPKYCSPKRKWETTNIASPAVSSFKATDGSHSHRFSKVGYSSSRISNNLGWQSSDDDTHKEQEQNKGFFRPKIADMSANRMMFEKTGDFSDEDYQSRDLRSREFQPKTAVGNQHDDCEMTGKMSCLSVGKQPYGNQGLYGFSRNFNNSRSDSEILPSKQDVRRDLFHQSDDDECYNEPKKSRSLFDANNSLIPAHIPCSARSPGFPMPFDMGGMFANRSGSPLSTTGFTANFADESPVQLKKNGSLTGNLPGDFVRRSHHTPLVIQKQDFAQEDLGTPVTERGSPADIDVECTDDLGIDDEDRDDLLHDDAAAVVISPALRRHDSRQKDNSLHYKEFAQGYIVFDEVKESVSSTSDMEDRGRARRRNIPRPPSGSNNSGTQLRNNLFPTTDEDDRAQQTLILKKSRSADSPMNVGDTSLNTSFTASTDVNMSANNSAFMEPPVVIARHASNNSSHHQFHSSNLTSRDISRLSSGMHNPNNLSHTMNDSRNHSNNNSNSNLMAIFRPLPDQSAFDESSRSELLPAGGSKQQSPTASSFICPPTPQRTPMYSHIDHLMMSPGVQKLAIYRQSSLTENKVLLAQRDDDPVQTISFHEDFISEGRLGSGKFADVYKVREKYDLHTHHAHGSSSSRRYSKPVYYAVKRSKIQFRSKRDRDGLLNEVRIMKLVSSDYCENITQFVRAWQEDSHFYVQINFAERGTVHDLLNHLVDRKECFPDICLWKVIRDVASGLAHIHGHGIVHLDIKPANLLINEQGNVLIGDFGVATYDGSQEDGHEGDTRYMAIELLNNPTREYSADIFSLGLSVYELSYGPERLVKNLISLPYDGSGWQLLRSGAIPHYDDHRSASLHSLILRCIAVDPSSRPTAKELLQLPEVRAMSSYTADPTLLSAPELVLPPPHIQRSASCNLGRMALDVAQIPPEEYAAMMERAITPH